MGSISQGTSQRWLSRFPRPAAADGEVNKRRDLPCRDSVGCCRKKEDTEMLRVSPLLEVCLAGLRAKFKKVQLRGPHFSFGDLEESTPRQLRSSWPSYFMMFLCYKREHHHKLEIDPLQKSQIKFLCSFLKLTVQQGFQVRPTFSNVYMCTKNILVKLDFLWM